MQMDGFDFNIDLGNFSEFSINLGEQFETKRYICPPKSVEIEEIYLTYSNAEKLENEIDLNNRNFCIINGSFIFGDFIEALITKKDLHVKEMMISTLSLSLNNIDSLANLIKWEYLDKLDLIVSDYFYSHERSMLVQAMYERLDNNDKFQLAAAGVHTKICLMETTCGKKIIIHGSPNLRSSANIEQFVIENNTYLYDFNKEYHDRIIKTFHTIKKAVRGPELWNNVTNKKEA
jgi:hypothetical protein